MKKRGSLRISKAYSQKCVFPKKNVSRSSYIFGILPRNPTVPKILVLVPVGIVPSGTGGTWYFFFGMAVLFFSLVF